MKNETKEKLEHLKWRVQNQAIRVKNFAAEKGGMLIDWVVDNPAEAIGLVTLGVSGLKASQSLVVSHRNNKERKRIEQTYYDPSTGFHWNLRRKANNNDRLEISRRKKMGQETGDILRDLRLI